MRQERRESEKARRDYHVTCQSIRFIMYRCHSAGSDYLFHFSLPGFNALIQLGRRRVTRWLASIPSTSSTTMRLHR